MDMEDLSIQVYKYNGGYIVTQNSSQSLAVLVATQTQTQTQTQTSFISPKYILNYNTSTIDNRWGDSH